MVAGIFNPITEVQPRMDTNEHEFAGAWLRGGLAVKFPALMGVHLCPFVVSRPRRGLRSGFS